MPNNGLLSYCSPAAGSQTERPDVGIEEKMMDQWHFFNPFQWALRFGMSGLVAAVSLVMLALVTVAVVLRKPRSGDMAVLTLARVQFLLCLLVVNQAVILSLFCLCSPAGRLAMWNYNMIYVAVTCLINVTVLALCVAGTLSRYQSRLSLTPLDVIGAASAVLAVGVNVMQGQAVLLAWMK